LPSTKSNSASINKIGAKLPAGGVNNLQIRAADEAGNESVYEFSVTLDTIAPMITIVSEIPAITNESHLVVQYMVDADVTVFGAVLIAEFDLVEGNNDLEIRAKDWAGNESVYQFSVVLDTGAPVITIVSKIPDITNNPVLEVIYTVDGGAEMSKTFQLEEGANDLFIEATDMSGNMSRVDFSVILDTIVPVITPPAGSLAPILLMEAEFDLVEGNNDLEIRAQDAAGNVSTYKFSVILDTIAPVITIHCAVHSRSYN